MEIIRETFASWGVLVPQSQWGYFRGAQSVPLASGALRVTEELICFLGPP